MITIYIIMFALVAVSGAAIAYITKTKTNPYVATVFALVIATLFVSVFVLKMNLVEKEQVIKKEIIEILVKQENTKEGELYEIELKGETYKVKLRKNTKGEFVLTEMNKK